MINDIIYLGDWGLQYFKAQIFTQSIYTNKLIHLFLQQIQIHFSPKKSYFASWHQSLVMF